MTKSQRILAVVLGAAILISGFAFGRMAETPKTTAEESKSALAAAPSPASSPTPESLSPTTTEAASENQAFYLSDFKTGYTDGYNAGMSGQSSSVTNTTRAGYNDGFKGGYADGFQARAKQATAAACHSCRPTGSCLSFVGRVRKTPWRFQAENRFDDCRSRGHRRRHRRGCRWWERRSGRSVDRRRRRRVVPCAQEPQSRLSVSKARSVSEGLKQRPSLRAATRAALFLAPPAVEG